MIHTTILHLKVPFAWLQSPDINLRLCVFYTCRCLSTSGNAIISRGFSHCSFVFSDALRLQGTKETELSRTYFLLYTLLRALYSTTRSLKKLYIVQEMKQHPFARKEKKTQPPTPPLYTRKSPKETLCISNCTHTRSELGKENAATAKM